MFYFVIINNIRDNTSARVFSAIAASMRETREMISAVIAFVGRAGYINILEGIVMFPLPLSAHPSFSHA
jgi:hypothetical protein